MSKSLEAYNILLKVWQGNKEGKDYPNFDDINEALYTIKQDLEYLEQLNKENLDLINEIQEVHKENLTIKEIKKELERLRKENQELIVNKNVAQAVAFDQKREIGELKDKIAYLQEEVEGWQSAYEWLQSKNSILKLQNQELKDKLSGLEFWNERYDEENEKLEKAIEISKDKIGFLFHIDKDNNYYFSSKYLCNELTQQEYELLKEVLENE